MPRELIIDFDDTLFDCDAFKVEYFGARGDAAIQGCSQYLFSDALPVLNRFRAAGYRVTILSQGDPEFQRRKITACRLASCVDELSIGPEKKELLLSRLAAPDGAWFINDKIDETLAVLRAHPTLRAVLKRRRDVPAERYGLLNIPSFDTLSAVAVYIISRD